MNEQAREAKREYHRKWREKNAEKLKKYRQEYARKNKEKQRKREEDFFNRLAKENGNGNLRRKGNGIFRNTER